MFLPPEHESTKFTKEHDKILRETLKQGVIPGTILQDIENVLAFVKNTKVELTASAKVFGMKYLSKINQMLTHPIEVKLKRPQQKSYPHINGLYLLLRASGLVLVDTKGKKPILRINETAYDEWQNLNDTERYCTLLETWFFRAKDEILGERSSWGLPRHLQDCLDFWQKMPKNGLKVKGERYVEDRIAYRPNFYNIALLRMFGFLEIKDTAPEDNNTGWQIISLKPTPYGTAIFAYLHSTFLVNLEVMYALDDQVEEQFGVIQPILQPYCTDWKNNLSVGKWDFRAGTYTFKVSLGKIWRRIAISGKATLEELGYIIRVAVDFDSDHLEQFSYQNLIGIEKHVYHPYMDEWPKTSEVRVGDVPLQIGQSMTYTFDFGDNWEFDVMLEQVETDESIKSPKILEEHGEAPEQYPTWDDDDDGDFIMIDLLDDPPFLLFGEDDEDNDEE